MKIRKAFQGTVPENKIMDAYSSSNTDTYSCNYINSKTNILECNVYTEQSIAKETRENIKFTAINKIGNGISISNGVITILNDNIQAIHIDATTQNTNWTSGTVYMYAYVNGTNRATVVQENTGYGRLNVTIPVKKGDTIAVSLYSSVAYKLSNNAWTYMHAFTL